MTVLLDTHIFLWFVEGDPKLPIRWKEFITTSLSHVLRQGELPPHHGAPFDRLLVAQCLVERVKIISLDPQMLPYGVVMPEP